MDKGSDVDVALDELAAVQRDMFLDGSALELPLIDVEYEDVLHGLDELEDEQNVSSLDILSPLPTLPTFERDIQVHIAPLRVHSQSLRFTEPTGTAAGTHITDRRVPSTGRGKQQPARKQKGTATWRSLADIQEQLGKLPPCSLGLSLSSPGPGSSATPEQRMVLQQRTKAPNHQQQDVSAVRADPVLAAVPLNTDRMRVEQGTSRISAQYEQPPASVHCSNTLQAMQIEPVSGNWEPVPPQASTSPQTDTHTKILVDHQQNLSNLFLVTALADSSQGLPQPAFQDPNSGMVPAQADCNPALAAKAAIRHPRPLPSICVENNAWHMPSGNLNGEVPMFPYTLDMEGLMDGSFSPGSQEMLEQFLAQIEAPHAATQLQQQQAQTPSTLGDASNAAAQPSLPDGQGKDSSTHPCDFQPGVRVLTIPANTTPQQAAVMAAKLSEELQRNNTDRVASLRLKSALLHFRSGGDSLPPHIRSEAELRTLAALVKDACRILHANGVEIPLMPGQQPHEPATAVARGQPAGPSCSTSDPTAATRSGTISRVHHSCQPPDNENASNTTELRDHQAPPSSATLAAVMAPTSHTGVSPSSEPGSVISPNTCGSPPREAHRLRVGAAGGASTSGTTSDGSDCAGNQTSRPTSMQVASPAWQGAVGAGGSGVEAQLALGATPCSGEPDAPAQAVPAPDGPWQAGSMSDMQASLEASGWQGNIDAVATIRLMPFQAPQEPTNCSQKDLGCGMPCVPGGAPNLHLPLLAGFHSQDWLYSTYVRSDSSTAWGDQGQQVPGVQMLHLATGQSCGQPLPWMEAPQPGPGRVQAPGGWHEQGSVWDAPRPRKPQRKPKGPAGQTDHMGGAGAVPARPPAATRSCVSDVTTQCDADEDAGPAGANTAVQPGPVGGSLCGTTAQAEGRTQGQKRPRGSAGGPWVGSDGDDGGEEEGTPEDDTEADDSEDGNRQMLRSACHGSGRREITLAALRTVYTLPINEAARQLGVGVTVMKKYCRKFNISRWPYRKLQSMDHLIRSVEEYMREDPAGFVGVVEELHQFRESILDDPGVNLEERIKKLRQANFKLEYKLRQPGRRGGGGAHG